MSLDLCFQQMNLTSHWTDDAMNVELIDSFIFLVSFCLVAVPAVPVRVRLNHISASVCQKCDESNEPRRVRTLSIHVLYMTDMF